MRWVGQPGVVGVQVQLHEHRMPLDPCNGSKPLDWCDMQIM